MANGMVQRVVHFRQRGEQGPSGNQTETRYKSNNSGTTPPSFSETGGNTDWSTTPTAITTTNRYRWKIIRTRENDEASWGRWSASIDAYLSKDGDPGDGYTLKATPTSLVFNPNTQLFVGGSTITITATHNGAAFTGGSLVVYAVDSSGNTNYTPASLGVAFSASSAYVRYDAYLTVNSVQVASTSIPIARYGTNGQTGATGRMFYMMGAYTAGTTYERTSETVPMVYFDNGVWNAALGTYGNYYYLADGKVGTNIEPESDSPLHSVWIPADSFGVVITQGIFAEFAKFGSAIISGDCMFSTNGRIGSTEYNNGATYLWNRPAYMWFVGNTEYFLADYSQQKGVSSGGTINVGQEILMKPQSIIQGTATLSRVQSEASTSDRVYLKLYDVTNDSYVNFVANGASVSEFRLTTTKQEVSLSYTNQSTSDKNVRWKIVNNYSSSRNLNIGFEVELANTFEPNWWVDLLTGRTYQTDAVVRGDVQAISVISSNDQMETVIEAGSVKVRSKTTQSYGIFRINSFGEVVLSMFDKDGNKVIDLGGTAETQINGEWVTWKLKYLSSSRPSSMDKSYYTASESDCSIYYQLQLGQVRNTNNTLEYFLPPVDDASQGLLTTNQSVIDRNNNVFTSKATGTSKTALENNIIGLTKITNGYYIKPNNGRFEVDANQYGPTNYKVDIYHFVGGLLDEIVTQKFSL